MSLYQNGSCSTFNQFICSVMNWFVMLVLPLFQWRRGSFHFFPRWVWRRWFCPRPPLFWPGPTPRLAPVRNCWTIVIILSDIVWQRRRKMTITGKLYCMNALPGIRGGKWQYNRKIILYDNALHQINYQTVYQGLSMFFQGVTKFAKMEEMF